MEYKIIEIDDLGLIFAHTCDLECNVMRLYKLRILNMYCILSTSMTKITALSFSIGMTH